jgi:excisionase family DNA binding protein
MVMKTLEVEQAAAAAEALLRGRAVVVSESAAAPVELPDAAVAVLAVALEQLRQGHRVRVIADDEEITTQEAADLLNVSRPYVVGLIERRELPCRKVGARRRLRLTDVLTYRKIQRARQRDAADSLANEAQELGIY